jgi:signal peptidase II
MPACKTGRFDIFIVACEVILCYTSAMKKSFAFIGLLLLLDLAAKQVVLHNLATGGGVVLSSFFNIVLVWNTGISFSILAGSSQFVRWFLVVAASVIVLYLVKVLSRESRAWPRRAWSMIIAGALGNIVDRVRYGAVVDFLDFHIGRWHWPAFNVADALICVGVLILLLRKK